MQKKYFIKIYIIDKRNFNFSYKEKLEIFSSFFKESFRK